MKGIRSFALLAHAALSGGLVFSPSLCCLAQERPPQVSTDSAGAVARLEERLATIEAKLHSLENRLDAVEDARAGKPQQNTGAQVSQANPLAVDSVSSRSPAIEGRFEALDQKLRIIERRRELEQESAAEKVKVTPVVAGTRDGFSITSANKDFQLKIAGYFQGDSRFYVGGPDPTPNTFAITRARPIFEGTVFKYFDFRIMPDFGAGQTVLQDLHMDFTYLPTAKLRAGKFKSPFGLERLMSARELLFVARAFPTQLAPNRDVGVQVYGDIRGGALNYAVAALNGVPDGGMGDVDTNNAKEIVARAFVQPFKNGPVELLNGLGFGLAGSSGSQQGSLPSFKTSTLAAFFSYAPGVIADGGRYRLSPQAYYYAGPFGMLTEYVYSSQEVASGSKLGRIQNRAWQVAASYVLSGGKPSYRGVSPLRVFNPKEGVLGAFELAARYNELDIDPEAFSSGFANLTKSARQASAWEVGLNWYMTKVIKFVINYEQTRFQGGGPQGDRPTEHAVLSRFQVGF